MHADAIHLRMIHQHEAVLAESVQRTRPRRPAAQLSRAVRRLVRAR